MSLFRSLGEVTETIIFTGSSILVFCLVSENFKNSVAFLVFLNQYKMEIEHNNVKTVPTNLFEMENGPNNLILSQKSTKRKWFNGHLNTWECPLFD